MMCFETFFELAIVVLSLYFYFFVPLNGSEFIKLQSDTHMQCCFFPSHDSQISPSECGGQQLLWLRSQWKCQCCTETSPALVCSQSGGTNFMIMAIYVCFHQNSGDWTVLDGKVLRVRKMSFVCWLFFRIDLFWDLLL